MRSLMRVSVLMGSPRIDVVGRDGAKTRDTPVEAWWLTGGPDPDTFEVAGGSGAPLVALTRSTTRDRVVAFRRVPGSVRPAPTRFCQRNVAGLSARSRSLVAMEPVIQAEGLVKNFTETTALDGVGFSARRGTVLGLLGPNGSGKTTSVRVLTTLLRPDGGRARILGRDVVHDAPSVRRLIGLTGQYAAVDEALTGTDNLVLVGRLLDLPRRAARARAAELIERFGLTEAAGRLVRTYSGGMRRRLDLAVSLVGRPEVLFLDEPTTGLDPRHRGEVWDAVRALVADGVTVLLTTQYLEEADQLADDLVVLDRGRVIAAGTPATLKAEVGGQRLHVRPLHREDLPRVAALLAETAPGTLPSSDSVGELIVPGGGPGLLHRLGLRLDESGIAVAELGLRLPSLDDVFLTLTGSAPKPALDEQEVVAA